MALSIWRQEAVTTACTRGFNNFAKFCSHLLASLVHFNVVKPQAILINRLEVAEVIYHSSWGRRSYFRRNFISSASFKTTKFLPRWICSIRHNIFACGLCLSRGDELIKRKYTVNYTVAYLRQMNLINLNLLSSTV